MAVASARPYASLHLVQADSHASMSPLSFLQAGCPSCHPSNSVKAPNAKITTVITRRKIVCTLKSYEFIHLCMVSMIAVCDMQYLSMILTLIICLQNSIVLLMNRGKKATL